MATLNAKIAGKSSKGYTPQPGPQTRAHACSADILLFGGQAGGGKSIFLVAEPSRHSSNPTFAGVLFRQSYPQIMLPGGLWSKCSLIYPAAKAIPTKTGLDGPKWTFPSGAEIYLRHIKDDSVIEDYQGSEVPYFAFDELTHFSENAFFNIALSRGRSTSGVKPYIRASCNPDPDSWVKRVWAPWVDEDYDGVRAKDGEIRYFIREEDKIVWVDETWRDPETGLRAMSITFIASSVYDNKILLKENPEYLRNLKSLGYLDRERLLYGNWSIRSSGNMFKFEWFENKAIQLEYFLSGNWHPLEEIVWALRGDFASSEVKPNKPEPDFSATCLLGKHLPTGEYIIADMTAVQRTPHNVKSMFTMLAKQHNSRFGYNSMLKRIMVRYEREPGSAGVWLAEQLESEFTDYDFAAVLSTGSKVNRAKEISTECERGKVYYITGDWNKLLWRYLTPFPRKGVKDDPVDALSGAHYDLNIIPEFECQVDPSQRFGTISRQGSSLSLRNSQEKQNRHSRNSADLLTGARSTAYNGRRWIESQSGRDKDIRNS